MNNSENVNNGSGKKDTVDEQLDDKLALLINGQLDEETAKALEAEIENDKALADEAKFLKSLQEGIQHQDHNTPPGGMGLARLKREIAAEQARAKPPAANFESEKTKAGSHTVTSKNTPAANSSFWKPLSIAACCLLGVQTFFMVSQQEDSIAGIEITPLSSAVLTDGDHLQVVFRETATASQIRDALVSVNGSLVGGPGALGVYTVQLPVSMNGLDGFNTLKAYPFVEEVELLGQVVVP